jgi:hypothetical protein
MAFCQGFSRRSSSASCARGRDWCGSIILVIVMVYLVAIVVLSLYPLYFSYFPSSTIGRRVSGSFVGWSCGAPVQLVMSSL